MNKKNAIEIIEKLKKYYPEATCSLNFNTPFQLLVAVVLSAQCTDERVNKTTPILFKNYDSPTKIAQMSVYILEDIIRPCGFYKNKAKNIKQTAQIIIDKYNGSVPNNMEDLVTLPGVGRKSANVVMLEAFNSPQGIAVDTHAKRISNRLGFSKNTEPEKIEQDLINLIPKQYFYDVNHLLMWHGRNICTARKPQCDKCPVKDLCKNKNL